MYSFAIIPCFIDHLTFVFDFRQLPCKYFLQNCSPLLPLHLHQIVVTQFHSSSCNMMFMIFVMRSFHAYPHSFVGFTNTSIFCLVFSNCDTGFPVLATLEFLRRCGWHRNFQHSTSIFHYTLEFLIIRINEINTAQFSGIIEFWFLDGPLLFLTFLATKCVIWRS